MLRDAIRTLVRKRLGDTNATYWSNDELNTMINNACNDISFRAKCVKANGTLSSVDCTANATSAGSNEYTLTGFGAVYAILEASFMQNGTRWTPLDSTTRDELKESNSGWMQLVGYTSTDTAGTTTYNYASQPGTPSSYYWSREENIFGLYPPPDTDNTGDYIKIKYATKHTELTGNTAPTIPERLHLAIVDFCVATGSEDRGYGEKSNDYWNKYRAKLQDYKVERQREREDEELVMVPHSNL